MSFARTNVARSLRYSLRHASARPAVRTARSGQAQLVTRRWASTGGDHGAPSSDLPWLLAGVAFTVPSVFYLWPSSSSAEHGHGHEEHEEQEEEASSEEEKPAEESSDDSAPADEEKSEDKPAEQKEESQPSPAEDAKESVDDKPEEDSKSASSDDSEGSSSEDGPRFKGPVKGGAPDERKIEPDSKGALKKRIDSGLQKELGEPASGSDEKKGEGSMESKQSGLSNTSTRHSTKIDEDPNKSKKSEGVPETAKISGTVDPNRPQV